MFIKLTPNAVKSNEGFLIQRVERDKLLYQENPYKILIEIEAGFTENNKEHFLSVYTYTITHWEPPYENEPISEEKKQQIIQRICAALDFLEIRYVLEGN